MVKRLDSTLYGMAVSKYAELYDEPVDAVHLQKTSKRLSVDLSTVLAATMGSAVSRKKISHADAATILHSIGELMVRVEKYNPDAVQEIIHGGGRHD